MSLVEKAAVTDHAIAGCLVRAMPPDTVLTSPDGWQATDLRSEGRTSILMRLGASDGSEFHVTALELVNNWHIESNPTATVQA